MLSASGQRVKGSAARRFGVLFVAVLIGGSVAFAAVELTRPGVQPATKIRGGGAPGPPGPTVARPLASGAEVSMSQATAMFGSALALPTTSAAQPSDAGPVWALSIPGGTTVAITFPSKGMFVEYSRPAPYPDPASGLKELSADFPSSQLLQLNGTTPAIYLPGNTGQPPLNAVLFQVNDALVSVNGQSDEATLDAIAQSILRQLTSSPSSS